MSAVLYSRVIKIVSYHLSRKSLKKKKKILAYEKNVCMLLSWNKISKNFNEKAIRATKLINLWTDQYKIIIILRDSFCDLVSRNLHFRNFYAFIN